MARLAIRMPKMSMTMTEGEVSEWSVKVGEEVAVGDVVCEVMTDKVDMEVESTVAGTLVEIVVDSGMADVGAPIGWVEGEDDGGGFGDLLAAPDPTPEPAAAAPAPDPEPEPVAPEPTPEPAASATVKAPQAPLATETTSDGVPAEEAPATTLAVETSTQPPAPVEPLPASDSVSAVPRARALARERGLDLASVTGSGPGGLIRVADVEAASTSKSAPKPAESPAETAPAAPAAARPVAAAQPQAASPAADKVAARRTAVRRAVARVMVPTAAIPQFSVWREVHLDAANGLRQGLSWTTVLLRAYAASLREVPELLSRWEDDAPTAAGPPVIALAVATERGLLVPTFVEPDAGDAKALDAEIRQVIKSAHAGRVEPAYMTPANGSLSNLGGMGVDRFQALLTPPQASVLSLGSIRNRPVAVTGGLGVALTVEAGVTVDHRVADGIHAATLLERFAHRLTGGL